MVGYSGTPLAQKLGIKDGMRVAILNGPDGYAQTLRLPPTAKVFARLTDGLDMIQLFTRRRGDLEVAFARAKNRLQQNSSLWISWPKKSSGVATDLTEDVIREIGLAAGLVDVKVCAVDDVWSGLKFVYRLKDRK